MNFIILILLIAVVFTVIAGVGYIIYRIKGLADNASFALNALEAGLKEQAEELEHTPKSVNGMTSLCLPRIIADFPAFNWNEFKQKAENMLKSAFLALTQDDITKLTNASADLRNQISLSIAANKEQCQKEVFRDVKIHQTEIATYRKMGGTCVITLQTSVGYYHYIEKSGSIICGSKDVKQQVRYSVELQYIQDVEKIAEGETALGVTCPNCGAPITGVGQKTCAYCGLAVTEININAWALNRYKLC
ncbi:MAG: zinc-ribbon domain-containing transport protein [Clostridia bacterium]|nr:zinc-ribbon domain-containing transport protein [Clostridia bacterium]